MCRYLFIGLLIENAMEAGTGIVMHIWTADSTGMQYYTFWAQ